MKKIIGNPQKKNEYLIDLIKKTKINNWYIKNQGDFRNYIVKEIKRSDDVLDIGRSMREKYDSINSNSLTTLDSNDFGDYPEIIFDICDNLDESLINKYDKIICLAILEHVYDPFKAVGNLKEMLKSNGMIFGFVPYMYYYHAPENLKFQDYFRFSKDALSFLFREYRYLEIFPVRGRISSSLNNLFAGRWKKYADKTKINIFLDKLSNDEKNSKQCSGFNFVAKK